MKKMLVALGLLAAIAVAAWAQTSGTNTVAQGTGYRNATTGANTDASGNALVSEAAKDRDSYLAPLSIFSGTIAAGAADTTDIVDLSGYRTVALLVQVSSGAAATGSAIQRFAFHARYNLAGASDSLSLFSLPVVAQDSVYAHAAPFTPGVGTTAAACGSTEFPVTITTTGNAGLASTASIPQGRVVYLTLPQGAIGWPSRCSFRIRNIARTVANTPTVRVWVMGTPL